MIRKRKLAAVGYVAFGRAAIKRYKPRRKIDSLYPRKAKSSEGVQPVAAPAKKLDDASVTRELSHAQLLESLQGSMNGLLGRFKTQVRRLPRIRTRSFRDAPRVIRHFCVVLFESDRLSRPLYLILTLFIRAEP